MATPFVAQSSWEACRGPIAPLSELPLLFGGLDLSSVNDLAALVLVGCRGDKWHTHCRFCLPAEGLAEKSRVDHTPFDVWARQGHLQTTPGRTIDLDFVAHELRELFATRNIRRIAYDPWNWDFFKPSLARAGFTESVTAERFEAFPQTSSRCRRQWVISNGRCSLVTWSTTTRCSRRVSRTPRSGRMPTATGGPDKKKATQRIDGTVALIMALAMAPAAQMRPFDAAALIG